MRSLSWKDSHRDCIAPGDAGLRQHAKTIDDGLKSVTLDVLIDSQSQISHIVTLAESLTGLTLCQGEAQDIGLKVGTAPLTLHTSHKYHYYCSLM